MSKIYAVFVDHKVKVPVSSGFDANFITIQVCFCFLPLITHNSNFADRHKFRQLVSAILVAVKI